MTPITDKLLPPDFVPIEIIEAARKVEHWFKSQNLHGWKLCGIQERDDTLAAYDEQKDEPQLVIGQLEAEKFATLSKPGEFAVVPQGEVEEAIADLKRAMPFIDKVSDVNNQSVVFIGALNRNIEAIIREVRTMKSAQRPSREELVRVHIAFEALQATCETWVREAISSNVMKTTLPSTIQNSKEALSILEKYVGGE